MKPEKKICFLISTIGKFGSPERQRSDDLVDYIISPIVGKYEYKVVRADDIYEPGSITTQIVKRLINAELVIADLSDLNANVFYELAIRHAVQKPFILMAQDGTENPFDMSVSRTIPYDLGIRKAETAKKILEEYMKNLDDTKFTSPVTETILDLQIRESGVEGGEILATILDEISNLRAEVRTLDNLAQNNFRSVSVRPNSEPFITTSVNSIRGITEAPMSGTFTMRESDQPISIGGLHSAINERRTSKKNQSDD